MIEIVSAHNCSFGNGTRRKGFVFAQVELKNGNKLYQLRSELRHPATKNAKELETATIVLAEGVTRRELSQVLNNPRTFEAVATKAAEPDLQDLNANQAIAAVGSMDAGQLEQFKAIELAGKKRKSVLEAIDAALESNSNDWRLIEIASLKIEKTTIDILAEANLATIGDVQRYIDEKEGLDLEGLTDELVSELLAAIKENIK